MTLLLRRSVVGGLGVAVTPPPTTGTSFTDTFDGSGGDLGSNWTLLSGAGQRISGQATSPNGESQAPLVARKEFDCGSTSMVAEVTWTVGDSTQDRSISVYARFSATENTCYQYEINDESNRYILRRIRAGAVTDLTPGFVSIPSGVTPGTGMKARLEVTDDSSGNPVLTPYWAGVKMTAVTDTASTSIKTGTRGGLGMYASAGILRVDDLLVAALAVAGGGTTTPPAVSTVTDTFPGTALSGNWTVTRGAFAVTDGVAIPQGSDSSLRDFAVYNAFQAPGGSQFVQIDLVKGSTADRSLGVLLRCPNPSAANPLGYLLEVNDANDRVNLIRQSTTGGDSLTGFFSVPGGVAGGVGNRLRLEAVDDSSGNVVLKLYWLGNLLTTVTDSASTKHTSGRYGGMYAYNGGGSIQGDNWSFGGL